MKEFLEKLSQFYERASNLDTNTFSQKKSDRSDHQSINVDQISVQDNEEFVYGKNRCADHALNRNTTNHLVLGMA